jgi:hypothetical protein
MSDYTNSKPSFGNVFPSGQVESDWMRVEPLITPEALRARFLFGVPLVSGTQDPITKKSQTFSFPLLQEFILSAVADLEVEMGISIMPSQRKRRLPYDRAEFVQFGFFRLPDRPIASLDHLRIEASDGTNFFEVPQNWVETGSMHWGQINILPLSPGMSSQNGIIGGQAASLFLMTLGSYTWIPAYWTVEYTTGFPNGLLPRPMNDLIATEATIKILSALSATYQRTSMSLSIDSMSQSTSGPGPQLYDARIAKLEEDKKKKINKIKKYFGLGIIVGNI